MNHLISRIFDKTIEYSFFLLFFLVPLFFTSFNYELFEYNKMMLTYGLTVIIVGSWVAKMIVERRIFIAKTPLDIPIAFFLLSQIISSIFSLDPHVSWWGYYSRFHGGLLSTITYILLYYAFASNFVPMSEVKTQMSKLLIRNSQFVIRLLLAALFSGFLVSLYAILERFGHSISCLIITHSFDTNCWVQDVQNRVFATLGQPNWLAAYLAVLIPISLALALNSQSQASNQENKHQTPSTKPQTNTKFETRNSKHLWNFGNWNLFRISDLGFRIYLGVFYFLAIIFYIALLFTRSRSGFLGFLVADVVLWSLFFRSAIPNLKRHFLLFHLALAILLVIISSPFEQINSFMYRVPVFKLVRNTLNPQAQFSPPTAVGPALETGGTDSGKIRQIVWTGAYDIIRHYPVFGSGVETFAFAYYRFRPARHNLTSEWDFLYNKAHNEYLNYAATTGLFGLGSYLLMIGSFLWWNIRKIKDQISKIKNADKKSYNFALCTLHFALFAGYASILVTNFFGFSVVVIGLFFFLIPAMSFILGGNVSLYAIPLSFPFRHSGISRIKQSYIQNSRTIQIGLLGFLGIIVTTMLVFLIRLWMADKHFATAQALAKAGQYSDAYPEFRQALNLNFSEPFYHDEFSSTLAALATLAHEAKESTLSAELSTLAISASGKALAISPNNVSFWKTRTRIFNILSDLDDSFSKDALEAIEQAEKLSPTDPKIVYNKGLLQSRLDRKKEAIETLLKARDLKPDYKESRFALAVFYLESREVEKAKEELDYILTKIDPNDEEIKKMREELK